jgi:hypothetical protein
MFTFAFSFVTNTSTFPSLRVFQTHTNVRNLPFACFIFSYTSIFCPLPLKQASRIGINMYVCVFFHFAYVSSPPLTRFTNPPGRLISAVCVHQSRINIMFFLHAPEMYLTLPLKCKRLSLVSSRIHLFFHKGALTKLTNSSKMLRMRGSISHVHNFSLL